MERMDSLILIADDNPDILQLVSRRLARCGYGVITASNGTEALELARAEHPTVAVLDWVMPGLTGLEVCVQVKEGKETAGMSVLLLTARATDQDLAAGHVSGADAYLTKPFDLGELEEAVRRLVAAGG